MNTRRRPRFVGDLKDLADYGFTYSPKSQWYEGYWQYRRIRIDRNGFIAMYSVHVDSLEKFAQLVADKRIEFIDLTAVKKHCVYLNDQEWEELLKKREKEYEGEDR